MADRHRHLILLTLLLCFCISKAGANSFDADQADRSVVRIVTELSEDKSSSGTGFLVNNEGVVATNHHVIANAERLIVIVPHSGQSYPADLIWSSAGKDLALIRVPRLQADPVRISTALSRKGEVVYAVGFPGVADDLSLGESLYDPTVTSGILGRIFGSSWDGEELLQIIQHSAPINSGNSGGPLFNACGDVIGVNTVKMLGMVDAETLRVNQSDGVNGASHISELVSALRAQNIAFQSVGSTCLAGVAVNLRWVYWGLGLLCMVLLGLSAYVLQLKGQVKSGAHPKINSVLLRKIIGLENPGPEQEAGESWKIDDHGREYRFDPILGIIYKPIKPDGNKQPVPPQKGVTLFALNGQSNINLLAGQSMLIGRDNSRCQVVLNDRKISSVHARLSYDGHDVYVEDQGSANGTFVNDRPVNTRLKVLPGQILRLTILAGVAEYRLEGAAGVVSPVQVLKAMVPGLADIPLVPGQQHTLGRAPSSDVVIANGKVSSTHCRIEMTSNNTVTVTDLDSSNGTFVDGMHNRVTQADLSIGQYLYLASDEVAYQLCNGKAGI